MICRRCLRKGLTFRSRPSISSPTFVRPFSASTTENSADAGASTSPAEDPLSTPISSPGVPLSKIIAASNAKKRGLPTSIAPAGTSLAGLNYVKGKQDPIALDEAEYPEWLWQCLDVKTTAEGVGQETKGDEFSKSKKQRRLAAKTQRKLEARMLATGNTELLEPKIPIQHQTIDLPSNPDGSAEGALEAAEAREELRSAMRGERRKKIKEDNFLKGMK